MLGSRSHKGFGGGFVLKEKLKAAKARLKVWNKEKFGDTQKKIQRIERELNKLEIEGDERQLSDDELLTQKKTTGGAVDSCSIT